MPLKTKLEVLSQEDIARTHDASLKILKESGVVFKCREALDIFKQHGVKVDGETVYFSGKMVESALEKCPATFRWQARNDARSITIGEGFAVQPNGGPVDIQDWTRVAGRPCWRILPISRSSARPATWSTL